MKRHIILVAFVTALVGIGAAAAASRTSETATHSAFDGKSVIVTTSGSHFVVSKDARFETVGDDSFVVLEVSPADGPSYDYWLPLDDVKNIRVFDSFEDAKEHQKLPVIRSDDGDAQQPDASENHDAD